MIIQEEPPHRDIGPAIIGRAEKGPILQPVKVDSFFDFVNTFGEPIPGGRGGDVYRDGNYTSPTYGAYAAQAWFRSNAPVTFVRLGGQAAEDAVAGGLAGWQTTDISANSSTDDNGGAFGLFISDAPDQSVLTASLAVADEVILADNFVRIFADGVERIFQSGAANSTEDAAIMTFVRQDQTTLRRMQTS